MNAIDFLRHQGIAVRLRGSRVVVSPASRLTDGMRRYIRANRLALIAELASADGLARRCHWRVDVPGYRPFSMISTPITHDEALAIAQSKWPNAKIEHPQETKA